MENKAHIQALYDELISGWNQKNADKMASVLDADAVFYGYDGSFMKGPMDVREQIGQIFKDYPTGEYVTITKEIAFISEDAAMLRAIAGMLPRGHEDINPNVNAWQTMVARKSGEKWRVILFQNTPAAFHGRPELVMQMANELRVRLKEA